MAVDYSEAIRWLDSLINWEDLGWRRRMAEVVDLRAMYALVALVGDPHLGLRAIHIAGSKGKGSTAAMLEAILRAAGYTTGLYCSPHLLSPCERILINGRPISPQRFAELASLVRPAADEMRETGQFSPSYFEVLTAMAFVEFSARRVDWAIVEVGLGGRLDATNVIEPTICAITTICLEHTDVLGETLAEIAAEKAGIIKPAVPVVIAPDMLPEAEAAVREKAQALAAPVVKAPEARIVQARPADPGQPAEPQLIEIAAAQPARFRLGLLGEHQGVNAAVAWQVCQLLQREGAEISAQALADGFRRAHWPGRLQSMPGVPRIVLDCAHTPAAAAALARSLPRHFRFSRLIAVVGMSADKDAAGFATALKPLQPRFIATRARLPRAAAPESLQRALAAGGPVEAVCPDVPAAIDRAREIASPDDLVLVTGSVFVVAEAMEHLGVQPFPES